MRTNPLHRQILVLCWLFWGQLSFALTPGNLCIDFYQLNRGDYTKRAVLFLHEKDSKLHMRQDVLAAAKGQGISPMAQPHQKLMIWLENMSKDFSEATASEDNHKKTQIKNYYHDLYLTRSSSVPESFFDLQKRILLERGHGDVRLTWEQRQQAANTALADQRVSLDTWLNYFTSSYSESYPIWAKYWVLAALGKMGKFDSASGKFAKRSSDSMSMFPDLNHEALALTMDAIVMKVRSGKQDETGNSDLVNSIKSGRFGDIYGYFLRQQRLKTIDRTSVDGRWVLFPKGSDPKALSDSLCGMNTGWCTAGPDVAKTQLEKGDFHVFYSKDTHGAYTVPRVAIRMVGQSIAEVRGVSVRQELDPIMATSGVVDKKLEEFGSQADYFKKKSADMKLLTEIHDKVNKKVELSTDELRFLYEVDSKIVGFGDYETKDPRIEEIKSFRRPIADFALIAGVQESEVYYHPSSDAWLRSFIPGIKVYITNIQLREMVTTKGEKFPEYIFGDLDLPNLTNLEPGTVLPKIVRGRFNMTQLKYASKVILPKVGLHLDVKELVSAVDVTFPAHIPGNFAIDSLRNFEGGSMPKLVGRIYLADLEAIKSLPLPKVIAEVFLLNHPDKPRGSNYYFELDKALIFPQ